jgi:hypothetical protein
MSTANQEAPIPHTPDEWREKVSPVITFPRLIAKSWSAFSKSRVIFKKPTDAKNAGVIFKTPVPAFWRQKLPNESTLKFYILRSSCPEEKIHSQYKLIVH